MLEIPFISSQILLLGVVASVIISLLLGYTMDWILTLLYVTNSRIRELVMVTGGFFGGMTTMVFVTSFV